ncbi:alpha/beta hydrolase [Streptomyces sp. RY43-2]|uniref:Alpha/beta hydrolase n=1 Tax=Streptomyces macrolidinus TaxID=2952607 RepID=A0ABT0ZL96_9ACTN|nr:alpha/beta fold hydrolase [Streptomyces macrolidinus]MCN9244305.1 alpha/beta hydrolase [Streptomyces macrolidinus]
MTHLHYDVRGDGPVLLVLPGGAGHPGGLDAMTDPLTTHFTVVTYDPLGLAHGRLGLPVEEQRVEMWSEGAWRVLQEVLPDGESAYVFGASSGGIAALDLLARHPERLRHVVAHEPPVVEVLPDAARQHAMFADVCDTYRRAGLQAAGARMAAGLEEKEPSAPVEGQPPSEQEELATPMAVFLSRVLRPFSSHKPDLSALKAAPLTLAAGVDSRGGLLHRTASVTAELTGSRFTEFPGGHVGALEYPREFGVRLMEALRGRGDR